jgi:nucleoside recognition membrane protein YjiH
MRVAAEWREHFIVAMVTLGIVVACVLLHYEALSGLTRALKRVPGPSRARILLLIFCILGLHVTEIWVFGAGYYYLIEDPGRGSLLAGEMGLLDCIYFSAVCFTTLGLGDIVPVGPIRFMVGTQALCGFVLIAWSGSFTFVEMQRFWRD